MFKHIMIPLDGSLLAQSSLPAAAYLAEKFHSRITLIHMIEKNAPKEVHGQTHLHDEKQAAAYLESVSKQQRFASAGQIDCHVHTAAVDNVAESIIAHAAELNCDLIVMCSHGRGKALHLMLGSIAQKVVALGTIPVLLTCPDEGKEVSPFSFQNLLLPLDGVADHEQSLPIAKMLSEACQATICLAMIVPRFSTLSGLLSVNSRFLPGTTSGMLEISVQQAISYLESHVESLRNEGLTVFAHVRRGAPATAIIDLAQELQSDLMVLATHGKSGMEAFWAGSVTNNVCSQCRIPMLLIPVEHH